MGSNKSLFAARKLRKVGCSCVSVNSIVFINIQQGETLMSKNKKVVFCSCHNCISGYVFIGFTFFMLLISHFGTK